MDEELLELCKRLQDRARVLRKYCILYPSVFKVVEPVYIALYAEDRRLRGVE